MKEEMPCAMAGCPASRCAIIGVSVYYVLLSLALCSGMVALFASLQAAIQGAGWAALGKDVVATVGSASPFSVQITGNLILIPDTYAIVVVLICGAFGGMVHGIRSFYFHVFAGDLEESELIRLVLRPLSGAVLALIFYLVLRAGMGQAALTTAGGAGLDSANATAGAVRQPEGASIIFYAAVAGIVGMFTDQTVAKLKKIAEAILTKPDEAPNPRNEEEIR